MRLSFARTVAFLGAIGSTAVLAEEFRQVTPPEGMARVSFKSIATNEQGDFVAVSVSRVYCGNVAENRFVQVHESSTMSFIVNGTLSAQVDATTVNADYEQHQTRLAINANGSFLFASNRTLWLGDARSCTVRQVAEAPQFSSFQQIAINDAGHIVATESQSVWVGDVASGSVEKVLVPERGNFEIFYMSHYLGRFEIIGGLSLMDLNTSGAFVVASTSEVYVGQASTRQIARVGVRGDEYFSFASIDENGRYIVRTSNEIFTGTVDAQ